MQKKLLDQIERALDERVRPALREHKGGIEIAGFESGVLKVRMLGQCSNCPSAAITNEQLIEKELQQVLPEVRHVVLLTGASDELLDMARFMLQHRERGKDIQL